jgi:hypothetical protein
MTSRVVCAVVLCYSFAALGAETDESAPGEAASPSVESVEDVVGPDEPPADSDTSSRVEDSRHFYMSVATSYGWPTGKIRTYRTDPYTVGIGGRVGWTFEIGLFLGASYSWFSGSEEHVDIGVGELNVSSWVWSACLDIGYDVWVDPVILRYALTVGGIFEVNDQGGSEIRKSAFQISPIFAVLVPIKWFVIGVEATFLFIPEATIPSAVTVSFPIGVRF